MVTNPVKLGIGLFGVSLLLLGVPVTMPFSPLQTIGGDTVYEVTRLNTTATNQPNRLVAYQDLPSNARRLIDRAIQQGEANDTVSNLTIGKPGLPEPGENTVLGVQYNATYYEFQTRLAAAGTSTDIADTRDWLILMFVRFGLIISGVGFIYYTEFGGPHSWLPAGAFGGLALTLWLVVYLMPFQHLTALLVTGGWFVFGLGFIGFLGVSAWRHFDLPLVQGTQNARQ